MTWFLFKDIKCRNVKVCYNSEKVYQLFQAHYFLTLEFKPVRKYYKCYTLDDKRYMHILPNWKCKFEGHLDWSNFEKTQYEIS